MKAHHHLRAFTNAAACLVLALPSFAQDAPKSVTVFSNVRIFDGKSDQLSSPSHVLVRGNVIEKISTEPIPDLLLVEGDPIADIKLIADPQKNFLIIMKDGKIFKNTLVRPGQPDETLQPTGRPADK